MEGEEVLYAEARSLIERAQQDPAIQSVLKRSAEAADEMISREMFHFGNVGQDFGHRWTGVSNGARFGRDYLTRTAVSKAYMLVHLPEEALYLATDEDSAGRRLDGARKYAIRFAPGQLPPVRGFWSLTVYDQFHFFAPNDLRRYSLGTKNESLQFEPDGSLILYLQHESPGSACESNWLPVPAEPFGVMLRCYLPNASILDRSWSPPPLQRLDAPAYADHALMVPSYQHQVHYAVARREDARENRERAEDPSRRSRRRRNRATRSAATSPVGRERGRPRRARR